MARTPEVEEALAAAQGLRSSVDGLGGEVAGLAAAVRRSRILIRVLAAGGALLAVALGVAVWALVQAGHADSRAAAATAKAAVAEARAAAEHESQVAGCRSGNDLRKADLALWNRLYAASQKGPETAKQRRANAALISFIHEKFALRNCAALYKVP
jgi:hypothetical protein